MQLRLPILRSPPNFPSPRYLVSCRRQAQVVCASHPGSSGVVVGIDLGTTNSAVAVVEGGVPRVIPAADGRTTPSVVSFGPDGQVLIGRAARRVAAKQPQNTFYSTKRLIGRRLKDVKHSAQKLAYEVDGSKDGSASLLCSNAPEGVLRPEEVGAQLLRHLLAAAEADLGSPVCRAVISVPAYFDPLQREATVAAGKLAGLSKVRLIREPVAAALAYGLDLSQEATVLVADLGGGTFDVALLEVGGGTVEVLSTGGDAQLGGDDWDAAIAKWINDKHLVPAGVRIRSPQMRARLRAVAEAAKIGLSDAQQVLLKIPTGRDGAPPLEILLTAQQLDSLAAPLYRRALKPLEDACRQAGVDLQAALAKARQAQGFAAGGRKLTRRQRVNEPLDVQIRPKRRPPISEVLLVGGATRMPAFRRFIENVTGLRPRPSAVDPDEAVAVGAAIQAAMLEGQLDDLMVMDVWQAALMRAFAKEHAAAEDLLVQGGPEQDRAALAAELGVSEEALELVEDEFAELTEEEMDALLQAEG